MIESPSHLVPANCVKHADQSVETFAKMYKTSNCVIPAKAGIQYYQVCPRFRVKPGMTNRGVMQKFSVSSCIQETINPQPILRITGRSSAPWSPHRIRQQWLFPFPPFLSFSWGCCAGSIYSSQWLPHLPEGQAGRFLHS